MEKTVGVLTTTQFLQAKRFETVNSPRSRTLVQKNSAQSERVPSLWFICSLHESTNNKDFKTIDPTDIKEVNERGKNTACHCSIDKIAIQDAGLGFISPFQYADYKIIKLNKMSKKTLANAIAYNLMEEKILELTIWSARIPQAANNSENSIFLI